jgi:hypothetical protein
VQYLYSANMMPFYVVRFDSLVKCKWLLHWLEGFVFLKEKKLVFAKDIHHENRKLDMLMTSAYEMTLKVVCDAFEETLLQHFLFLFLCVCISES